MVKFAIGFVFACSVLQAAFLPANRPIDVVHYTLKLAIDPSLDPKGFTAGSEIKLKLLADAKAITLDIENLTIENVRMLEPEQKELAFKIEDNGKILKVLLGATVKKNAELKLGFEYAGAIQTASHHGLFKVRDPDAPERGPLLFTQMEPIGARAVFPSNDEPHDKASTEVHVQVPERYQVVSNGRLTQDKEFQKNGQSWHEVHWLQLKPHPTYLVSLAIAPLGKIEDKSKSPRIAVWVGPKKLEKAEYILKVSREMIDYFEKYLGVPYPWAKYDTIGVPTFMWGGMENTSATHQNEERSLLNDPQSEEEKSHIVGLTAHEIAHQWFGNYVTPQWWDDLWLNESFATLLGYNAVGAVFGEEESEIALVTGTWDWYMKQEDGPRSHPIVNRKLKDPGDAFDSIAYTKGANVLRMLGVYVGKENLRAGFRQYLNQFALGNATYKDFFNTVAAVSNQKLDKFRDSWLIQRGYPVISYSGEWDSNTKTYRLKLSQHSNHKTDKSLFDFRLPVTFHKRSKPHYRRDLLVSMDGARHHIEIQLPAKPDWVTVNPRSEVLARVEPKHKSISTLALQAIHDPEPIARVWASYQIVGELVKGNAISDFAQKTALKVLLSDPSPYVRMALLETLERIEARWLPNSMGKGIFEMAQKLVGERYEQSALFKKDVHGWRLYRSSMLAALGRVNFPGVYDFLAKQLANPKLPLDDLKSTARSVARWAHITTPFQLRKAYNLHKERGYRYRYWILYSYASFEDPKAANEIEQIAQTGSLDLIGRMGYAISKNQTLIHSKQWSAFLQRFILSNRRFGTGVKARLLNTIEHVKTGSVREMLEKLLKESDSERIKAASKRILEKNFSKPAKPKKVS